MDHIAVFRLTDEEFALFAERLEHAFRSDAAGFFWDSTIEAHNIDVFDLDAAGISVEEWDAFADAVEGLHGLLVYIFEDAPDSVVRRYAEDHEEDLGDVAVKRVRHLRDACKSMAREWRNRHASVGPVLGNIEPQIIFAPGSAVVSARVLIQAHVPTGAPRRRPLEGSRHFLMVNMTAKDLARAINVLQTAYNLMPDLGGDLAAEDEPDVRVTEEEL